MWNMCVSFWGGVLKRQFDPSSIFGINQMFHTPTLTPFQRAEGQFHPVNHFFRCPFHGRRPKTPFIWKESFSIGCSKTSLAAYHWRKKTRWSWTRDGLEQSLPQRVLFYLYQCLNIVLLTAHLNFRGWQVVSWPISTIKMIKIMVAKDLQKGDALGGSKFPSSSPPIVEVDKLRTPPARNFFFMSQIIFTLQSGCLGIRFFGVKTDPTVSGNSPVWYRWAISAVILLGNIVPSWKFHLQICLECHPRRAVACWVLILALMELKS